MIFAESGTVLYSAARLLTFSILGVIFIISSVSAFAERLQRGNKKSPAENHKNDFLPGTNNYIRGATPICGYETN